MSMNHLLNRLCKALAYVAVAVGAVTACAAPALAQTEWKPTEDDSVLLDVRSGQWRVGSGVRGYQTNTGICVDFADIIMAFDLPVRLDKKSRRATGWLFEESRLITIDRDSNTVQIVNKNIGIDATDIRDTPEGWCVDTGTLSKWLNVDLQADLSNALLVVKADRKLPFELAEERKARAGKVKPATQFNLANLPQAKDPYRFWRTPSIDVVASFGGRKDNGRSARFDARYEIYASGEIAGASFDARLASDQRGVPETLRLRAYRSDPEARLLGPLRATHFALGDVSTVSTSLGLLSTAGRGAFVTNRPLERADSFDRTTFRGELPDGWDAELYRNDQLIGYVQSRGDGRYEFAEVPLLFGQNRFEVVLYGPQGQTRHDVRMIPVGIDSIPPRQTYYWAGVQDAGRDLIDFGSDQLFLNKGWRAGVGVERGIDTRTSLALSYSTAIFRGLRYHFVESAVRRAIGPALVEFSGASNLVGGYAARGQALAQIGETLLSAESVWFLGGFQSERFNLNLSRQHSLAVDQNVKIAGKAIPVHLEATHKTYRSGDSVLDAKARLSFNIKSISASSELIWQTQKFAFGTDPPARLDAALRLSGRVGGLRLRGEVQFGLTGQKGFQQSKLTGEWRASEKSDWRAELGYDGPSSRARLALGYTQRFDKFALTGQVEAASDGSVAAGISVAFSLGPKPNGGGVRMSSEKLAATGQALVTVFYDENSDGIRQSDEPVETAVELTAGLNGRGPPTNDKGQSFIDGLQPFQPILLGIDGSSLPDPFIQPADSGIVVTPRPGIPFVIDLPLVAAGEISGTLQRDDGKLLTGVDIELVNKRGQVVKTTRSEYDGYFLFESVPYGQYKLRISALSATVIGVDPELSHTAELNRLSPTVDIGRVIPRPSPHIAANTP